MVSHIDNIKKPAWSSIVSFGKAVAGYAIFGAAFYEGFNAISGFKDKAEIKRLHLIICNYLKQITTRIHTGQDILEMAKREMERN